MSDQTLPLLKSQMLDKRTFQDLSVAKAHLSITGLKEKVKTGHQASVMPMVRQADGVPFSQPSVHLHNELAMPACLPECERGRKREKQKNKVKKKTTSSVVESLESVIEYWRVWQLGQSDQNIPS